MECGLTGLGIISHTTKLVFFVTQNQNEENYFTEWMFVLIQIQSSTSTSIVRLMTLRQTNCWTTRNVLFMSRVRGCPDCGLQQLDVAYHVSTSIGVDLAGILRGTHGERRRWVGAEWSGCGEGCPLSSR